MYCGLGCDHDHAVGSLHAVDGRSPVLDDVDLVNIVGIDRCDVVGLESVDNEERLGMFAVGADSTDDDAGHLSGACLSDLHSRDLSADVFENVRILLRRSIC